jgi:hypothetical protein
LAAEFAANWLADDGLIQVVVNTLAEIRRRSEFEREVRALAALGETDELLPLLEELHSRNATREVFRNAARELRWHERGAAVTDSFGRLAAGWYQQALKDSSTRAVRILLAETLYELGNASEARALFEQLATEKPPEPLRTEADSVHEIVPLGYLGVDAAREPRS